MHLLNSLSGALLTVPLLAVSGLYGNDDFHNGLLQAFSSGKKVESLVLNLKQEVSNA